MTHSTEYLLSTYSVRGWTQSHVGLCSFLIESLSKKDESLKLKTNSWTLGNHLKSYTELILYMLKPAKSPWVGITHFIVWPSSWLNILSPLPVEISIHDGRLGWKESTIWLEQRSQKVVLSNQNGLDHGSPSYMAEILHTSDSQLCLHLRINGCMFKATLWMN